MAEGDKRRHGYSRIKRPDCPQVVIALVVTTDGYLPLPARCRLAPLADCTTLRMFLARIERQHGRARRVWVMDRGIPTEAVFGGGCAAAIRRCSIWWERRKRRLSRLEKQLLTKPWQKASAGVRVKLPAEDDELYVRRERRLRQQGTRDAQSPTEGAAAWSWPQWKSRARRC